MLGHLLGSWDEAYTLEGEKRKTNKNLPLYLYICVHIHTYVMQMSS